MQLWNTHQFEDITLTKGQGCTVWDVNGKAYIDLLAGTWCNILGYAHPRWTAAIQAQVEALTHVGKHFTTDEIQHALSTLKSILPPLLNRIVFLNTGSEAVEIALKIARTATQAEHICVIEKGYYGATNLALALSEAGRSLSYLAHDNTIIRLPAPTCKECPMEQSQPCNSFKCVDISRLNSIENIAAIMFEPVMAWGGVIIPPPGYVNKLRELANRYGTLLIAEEVTTGVGRTGRWFGFECDGIIPDILVIGKAIGAGLPVSAVITTQEVEERCNGALRHIQSHQNDPLSGRIVSTVINIIEQEDLISKVIAMGDRIEKGLIELKSQFPFIKEVRCKGLMVGIEMDNNRDIDYVSLSQSLLNSGYIHDYQVNNSTFRLFPPYIITAKEIDFFLETFESTLLQLNI